MPRPHPQMISWAFQASGQPRGVCPYKKRKPPCPQPPLGKGGLLSIALQMPAQRGQLFGAVYSVNKDSGLTELFPDTVMTAILAGKVGKLGKFLSVN